MDYIELIKKDKACKKDKYIANDYFNHNPKLDNDIKIDVVDKQGNIKTIEIEKGCQLYTNYFKMIVKQKIDFLLTNEPTVNSQLPFSITVISSMLEDMIKKASLDVTSWLHFYIENNKLDWVLVDDKEIIPIYDSHKKNIIEIIRYYDISKEEIKVEHWTMEGITTFIIKKNKINNKEIVTIEQESKTTHYSIDSEYQNEIIDTEYFNFEDIPFIPLWNNKEKTSDLDGIQELLDYYNSISSGFISNIERFQEAITKLQGFSGDKENLEETLKNMKKYKMVGVPEGGNIEYMAIEIPVEARKVLLDILKDNIFLLGRAVDINKIGDGNITNVVIKSRYANLDMKANALIKQIKLFYETFIKFINNNSSSNYDSIIEFNKSQIFNTSELLADCVSAIDLVTAKLLSKETLISNIPWVDDVKKEMKLIEDETAQEQEDLKNDLEAYKAFNNISGQNLQNENSGQNPSNGKGDQNV